VHATPPSPAWANFYVPEAREGKGGGELFSPPPLSPAGTKLIHFVPVAEGGGRERERTLEGPENHIKLITYSTEYRFRIQNTPAANSCT
jgi:hypothetical protein